jgi:hypothetical protein
MTPLFPAIIPPSIGIIPNHISNELEKPPEKYAKVA